MSEVKVINELVDAASGNPILIAEGSIERINIARINADGSPKITNITKGPNAGKSMKSTHRASMLLKNGQDQVWIGFGEHEVKNMKYENQYQVKEGEVWVDLKEGMIIRLPVVLQKWKDKDGNDKSGHSGKKARIIIKDKSGAREATPRQSSQSSSTGGSQSASTGTNTSGGKTTKVYGEIVSVSGSDVVVKTETGEVTVVLSEEQLKQLQTGGRLAGQRGEDGKIVTGFKAYGPAGQNNAGAGKSGGKSVDKTGLSVGHAINGALNLRRLGLAAPVADVANLIHDITTHLKADAAKDPAHKGLSDYDLGAMVGHAVLNATRDISISPDDNPEQITDKILIYSRGLMAEVVPLVTAHVKGEALQTTAASQTEPELKGPAEESQEEVLNENGHVDMTPEEVDFDDDIPFAYLGLQYPSHAIHSLF